MREGESAAAHSTSSEAHRYLCDRCGATFTPLNGLGLPPPAPAAVPAPPETELGFSIARLLSRPATTARAAARTAPHLHRTIRPPTPSTSTAALRAQRPRRGLLTAAHPVPVHLVLLERDLAAPREKESAITRQINPHAPLPPASATATSGIPSAPAGSPSPFSAEALQGLETFFGNLRNPETRHIRALAATLALNQSAVRNWFARRRRQRR